MLRFRLLVAWMMLALVPLQGLAAASNLCCAARADHHASSRVGPSVNAGGVSIGLRDLDAITDPMHTDLPAAPTGSGPIPPDLGHDAFEGCGLCASLCHAVAIAQAIAPLRAAAACSQEAVDAISFIAERPFAVADKPPRAQRT